MNVSLPNKKKNNDKSIEGFVYNETSGRFRSFLYEEIITFKENGIIKKQAKRKRHTFVTTIKTLEDAIKEKERVLNNLEKEKKISRRQQEMLELLNDEQTRLDNYISNRTKKVSKSTLENNVSYLKNYVFRYFYQGEVRYPPVEWPLHYEDFLKWLSAVKMFRNNGKDKEDKKLSINSKNNVIRALNSFLGFVEKDLPIKIKRCPLLDSKVQSKDETYLISEGELNELCEFFEKNGVDSLYLKTLYYTGMRAKEALGLSIAHIVSGDKLASKEFVYKYLKENDIQQFGYIFLQRQLLNDTNSRTLEFGPLKSRGENDSRYIPVINVDLMRLLDERIENCDKKKKDLLFYNVTYARSSALINEFYKAKGSINKGLHSLRHSFITEFIKQSGGGIDIDVALTIWGHESRDIIKVYLHLAEKQLKDLQLKENKKRRKEYKPL